MSRIHTETCQFCGRHGDVVIVEYPGNTLFWQCAKGCDEAHLYDTDTLRQVLDEPEAD